MPRPLIGHHVASPEPYELVRHAIARLDAEAMAIADLATADRRLLWQLAGLLHDLHPWTAQADRALRLVRDRAPGLPVLAYYPDTPAGLQAAFRSEAIPGVFQKAQRVDRQEPARLRTLLAAHVARAPGVRFVHALGMLLPDRSPPVARFVDVTLERLASGWQRHPKVEELALHAAVSPRQLRRSCWLGDLHGANRLLDWLSLLWIAWLALEHQESIGTAAAHLALTRKEFAGLETRLLGSHAARLQGRPAGDHFAAAVRAFVERLRMAPVVADEVIALGAGA